MDPMSKVREGMKVVSVSGEELGSIKSLKMGDPDAVTAEGQRSEGEGGFISAIAGAFTGDDALDAERRERLLRVGYIEVDRRGLHHNLTVAADRIDRVTDDVVYLTVEGPE